MFAIIVGVLVALGSMAAMNQIVGGAGLFSLLVSIAMGIYVAAKVK